MTDTIPALLKTMGVTTLDTRGVRDLSPDLLAPDGSLQVMPAAYYRDTTVVERALFCQRHGIYGLLTEELIAWLRERLAGRSAIEIGAGAGHLARALGIRATDSKMQDDPSVSAWYAAHGQPTVQYGPHVERLEAKEAVRKHRPQVVIASWVTHRYRPNRHAAGGNMFGVNEEEIIQRCEEYIFIGNTQVHAGKSIWSRPHDMLHPDWLYSRAHNGTPEFIACWRGGKSQHGEAPR
jgi:hypothetical protein